MKNTMKKLTVLLASTFLMMACGSTPSKEPAKSSNTDVKSSTQQVTSSEQQKTSEQQEQSSKQQEQSSQGQTQSSKQEEQSSQGQQSSQGGEGSSKQDESSQGQQSSQEDEDFKYKDYLLKHTGASAEYIFEAECTNLTTKEGLGYSGTASESNMAVHDMNGNSFVTYLYAYGSSVNFLVVCDRDITDGVLKARLGGEFMDVRLDPSNYGFRVDTIITEEDLEEAIGNWDAAFLDYYTDLSETGGYYINPWDCGSIHIDATGTTDPSYFNDFQITAKLKLKKGINCISLITENATSPGMGTMGAIAPVIDYISITTSANLGMYDICNNGEGDVGVHFKA